MEPPDTQQPNAGVRPAPFVVHSVAATGKASGQRLDIAIAALLPAVSRSLAQKLIKAGHVLVDGRKRPQGFRVAEGAVIRVEVPAPEPRTGPAPEVGDLPILYEDEAILVLNKRPGLVVHPGAGHLSGTLVNMLLASGRTLSTAGGEDRAGLVHRLDKDTSGAILVAKTDTVHEAMSVQFKHRVVEKTYLALVLGPGMPDRGVIESSFGRRPGNHTQFTGRVASDRQAVTEFECMARGRLCALVQVRPRTGRTHQIRVHLAESGHPVVGDHVYGRAYPRPGSVPPGEAAILRRMKRQALHAWRLRFRHPLTGEAMEVIAPLPGDMMSVIDAVFGDVDGLI